MLPERLGPLLAALLLVACESETPSTTKAVPSSAEDVRVDWVRELPIEALGREEAALHADPEGGLWLALPGAPDASGRLRVHYRPPGGSWSVVLEEPTAEMLSLSSVRGGEVYLAYSRHDPVEGRKSQIVALSPEGRRELPGPQTRVDNAHFAAVNHVTMQSDQRGWACGEHARVWEMVDGAWVERERWMEGPYGSRAGPGACDSLRLDGDELWVADEHGNGARMRDGTWTPLPRHNEARVEAVLDGSGWGRLGDQVLRLTGDSWRPVGASVDPGAKIRADRSGSLLALPDRLIDAKGSTPTRLPGPPLGLARADQSPWLLTQRGLYRGTRERAAAFQVANEGTLPTGLSHARALDVDRDGDFDLAALVPQTKEGHAEVGRLVIYLNDGAGVFAGSNLELPEAVRNRPSSFDFGDLDGDGDLDLVTIDVDSQARVWRLVGERYVAAQPFSDARRVELVDADGDGHLDLSTLGNHLRLRHGDGAGAFRSTVYLPDPHGHHRELRWHDVDRDGDADALLLAWRSPALLLRQATRDTFDVEMLERSASEATWADLDLDGTPELLLASPTVDEGATARCEADASACEPLLGSPPFGHFVDLNDDGSLDLISTSVGTRGQVFVRDPNGRFRRVRPGEGDFVDALAFDADGDGDHDLYAPGAGLQFNPRRPARSLQLQLHASRSDGRARGSWLTLRTAEGRILSSAAVSDGLVSVGLPSQQQGASAELRLPNGELRRTDIPPDASRLTLRDAETPTYLMRRFALWVSNSARLAQPWRDLGIALAVFLGLARFASSGRGRVRIALAALGGHLVALPFLLRLGSAWPWASIVISAFFGLAFDAAWRTWTTWRRSRWVGPYRLLQKLGTGASGTVWEARSRERKLAVKVFEAGTLDESDARERFFREVKAGSRVEHPNVVRVFGHGEDTDGRWYLAMQLAPGRSLRERIAHEGPLPEAEALTLAAQCAAGLGALHRAGVLHRDVKTENLIVDAEGHLLVSDFGLARNTMFKTMTRHEVVVGTLAYMSPEQSLGRSVDEGTDIWSLGVVLFEMLTGRLPFDAEHEMELLYLLHNSPPPALDELRPELSERTVKIVRRCLQRDRKARYADMTELEAVLLGQGEA